MTLTQDEEQSLRWRFDGSAEAALGVRSSLGPQLDRLRAGTVRCSSSPETRDHGADSARLAAIDRRLVAAGQHAVRVLAAYYGPQSPPVLPSFGPLGRVMALASDDEVGALEADAKKARKGDAGAAARVSALRAKAEAMLAAAQAAYSATRPERRRAG